MSRRDGDTMVLRASQGRDDVSPALTPWSFRAASLAAENPKVQGEAEMLTLKTAVYVQGEAEMLTLKTAVYLGRIWLQPYRPHKGEPALAAEVRREAPIEISLGRKA